MIRLIFTEYNTEFKNLMNLYFTIFVSVIKQIGIIFPYNF